MSLIARQAPTFANTLMFSRALLAARQAIPSMVVIPANLLAYRDWSVRPVIGPVW
jgi:hypothetical protein